MSPRHSSSSRTCWSVVTSVPFLRSAPAGAVRRAGARRTSSRDQACLITPRLPQPDCAADTRADRSGLLAEGQRRAADQVGGPVHLHDSPLVVAGSPEQLVDLAAGDRAVPVLVDPLEHRRRLVRRSAHRAGLQPPCRTVNSNGVPSENQRPTRSARSSGTAVPGVHGSGSTGSCSITWQASLAANAAGSGAVVEFISARPPVALSRCVNRPVMCPGIPPGARPAPGRRTAAA